MLSPKVGNSIHDERFKGRGFDSIGEQVGASVPVVVEGAASLRSDRSETHAMIGNALLMLGGEVKGPLLGREHPALTSGRAVDLHRIGNSPRCPWMGGESHLAVGEFRLLALLSHARILAPRRGKAQEE